MLMSDLVSKDNLLPPWVITPQKTGEYINAMLAGHSSFKKAFLNRQEGLAIIEGAQPRIGIEIESEKMKDAVEQYYLHTWKYKGDGSLRNGGIEFISPAMRPSEVALQLAAVYAWMDSVGATPEFSWRTSIHVHLECMGLTVDEFKNFLLLYLIFEDSLFQFAHPGRRETNIFCTPITRANFYSISHFMQGVTQKDLRGALVEIVGEIKKYSALNLCHLFDFGTVEFRHLRGTSDHHAITLWLRLLLALFNSAKKMAPNEIYTHIAELNTTSAYNKFIADVFGEDLGQYLVFPGHFIYMSKGITLAKEILKGHELFDSVKFSEKGGLSKFLTMQQKKELNDPLQTKSQKQSSSTIPPQVTQQQPQPQASLNLSGTVFNPNDYLQSLLNGMPSLSSLVGATPFYTQQFDDDIGPAEEHEEDSDEEHE